jgi:hypothetical protein
MIASAMNAGPIDLFFIFIMLVSLQPVLKQRTGRKSELRGTRAEL